MGQLVPPLKHPGDKNLNISSRDTINMCEVLHKM
jgi:hypothetical protein